MRLHKDILRGIEIVGLTAVLAFLGSQKDSNIPRAALAWLNDGHKTALAQGTIPEPTVVATVPSLPTDEAGTIPFPEQTPIPTPDPFANAPVFNVLRVDGYQADGSGDPNAVIQVEMENPNQFFTDTARDPSPEGDKWGYTIAPENGAASLSIMAPTLTEASFTFDQNFEAYAVAGVAIETNDPELSATFEVTTTSTAEQETRTNVAGTTDQEPLATTYEGAIRADSLELTMLQEGSTIAVDDIDTFARLEVRMDTEQPSLGRAASGETIIFSAPGDPNGIEFTITKDGRTSRFNTAAGDTNVSFKLQDVVPGQLLPVDTTGDGKPDITLPVEDNHATDPQGFTVLLPIIQK